MKKKIDKKKVASSIIIFLVLSIMIAIIMIETPMEGFEEFKIIFTIFLSVILIYTFKCIKV